MITFHSRKKTTHFALAVLSNFPEWFSNTVNLTLIDFLVRWKHIWAWQIGLRQRGWSASFKQLGRSSKSLRHTDTFLLSFWMKFLCRRTLLIRGAPPLFSRLTKRFLPFPVVSIPLATRKLCQSWSTQLSLAWFTSTTISQTTEVHDSFFSANDDLVTTFLFRSPDSPVCFPATRQEADSISRSRIWFVVQPPKW